MLLNSARKVLQIEAEAILNLVERIDSRFEKAVELLYGCSGRVIVTGVGKSGIIGRKIAATLASTGTPSLFLHPVDAIHGDLGMVVRNDLVLALSNSGETEELVRLLEILKRLGICLISMVGNPNSTLARESDLVLDVSIKQEACHLDLAPTASTTAALAMGDALAIALSIKRGFKEADFASLHPGGKLGKRLLRVEKLMHTGQAVPVVGLDTLMRDVIYEISRKSLGMTVVSRDGLVVGIITDGDLRRLLQKDESVLKRTAAECMNSKPVTIVKDELAVTALRLMEDRKITSLIVADDHGRLEGVLHLHALWQVQLF
ncbi:MAG: KpsF/GutQ family sugar-phosphate isomerase [Acidobacteriota bacterium]